jgi:hypothetical protein
MSDKTPETLSNDIVIVAVLEELTTIIQNQQQSLKSLFEKTERIGERVAKLEAGDSLDNVDAKFVKEVNAKLQSVLDVLRQRH